MFVLSLGLHGFVAPHSASLRRGHFIRMEQTSELGNPPASLADADGVVAPIKEKAPLPCCGPADDMSKEGCIVFGTDASPAADTVHCLGQLAGSAMPRTFALEDPGLDEAHSFSKSMFWLIPGHVLCGSYPGPSPGQPNFKTECILDAGVNTYVCLQDELPPQDAPWPEEGVPNLSERAKWAMGNFMSYREAAGCNARFLHYGLPDLSPAESLDALDALVCDMQRRVEAGDKLYLHCWGGRGRTGLVAACLLGALYGDIDAEEALQRVQRYYDLRQPLGRESMCLTGSARKLSPETEGQRNQVRDWFSFKRIVARADIAPASGTSRTYTIRSSAKPSEIIEIVGPSAIHPLTRADALKRESNAELLGRGQFGKVFRGRSTDGAATDVAIKVMPDGAPSHEQSRLALEAKILRAMSGVDGFPILHYDARQTVFGVPSDVLVMGLLGASVRSVYLSTPLEERPAAVRKIGCDVIRCLRELHAAGFVHNDIKPGNILFGPPGTPQEERAHLLDFGSATEPYCLQAIEVPEGCELTAGGGIPLFASLAQLQGRPTAPVDDIESLWYCLAFLEEGTLPWQWEPVPRVTNIKKRLFVDECAINSDSCDAHLTSEEACSTAHCRATYEEWDCSEALHELWSCVLEAQGEGGQVDYNACLLALADSRPDP